MTAHGAMLGPPVRILVADDSEVMRRGLRNLLESQDDWSVCSEARNGREALEKVEESNPDLVLLDFQMPEMNGLEAAREIRRRHPSVPILMVTLHMSHQLAKEAKLIGIRGACSKTDINCVVDAVDALLRNGTYYEN